MSGLDFRIETLERGHPKTLNIKRERAVIILF